VSASLAVNLSPSEVFRPPFFRRFFFHVTPALGVRDVDFFSVRNKREPFNIFPFQRSTRELPQPLRQPFPPPLPSPHPLRRPSVRECPLTFSTIFPLFSVLASPPFPAGSNGGRDGFLVSFLLTRHSPFAWVSFFFSLTGFKSLMRVTFGERAPVRKVPPATSFGSSLFFPAISLGPFWFLFDP